MGVPITPFNKKDDAVVVKHKSIEGGMGIHFYKVDIYLFVYIYIYVQIRLYVQIR